MQIRWKLHCEVVTHINDLGIGSERKGRTQKLVKVGKFFRNYWILINAFWICLRFVRYSLVKYRFVRYTFRFVRYRYPNKQFACLQDVFKTSSRHVFKTAWRRLQRNNFSSSKTSSRRLAGCLQDIFKTSCEDVLKTSWKTKICYAEDVLKTPSKHVLKTSSRRLEDQQMFGG